VASELDQLGNGRKAALRIVWHVCSYGSRHEGASVPFLANELVVWEKGRMRRDGEYEEAFDVFRNFEHPFPFRVHCAQFSELAQHSDRGLDIFTELLRFLSKGTKCSPLQGLTQISKQTYQRLQFELRVPRDPRGISHRNPMQGA